MSNIEDGEIITLQKVDAVYFRVYCTIGQSMELKEFFKCYAPNYKWHPLFRQHLWDGRVSFYDMKAKLLPIGLLNDFKIFCNNFKYKFKFTFDYKTVMTNDIQQSDLDDFYTEILKYSKDKLSIKQDGDRDYQNIAVIESIKNKRGVYEIGTGGGKCSFYDAEIEIEVSDKEYKKIKKFKKNKH